MDSLSRIILVLTCDNSTKCLWTSVTTNIINKIIGVVVRQNDYYSNGRFYYSREMYFSFIVIAQHSSVKTIRQLFVIRPSSPAAAEQLSAIYGPPGCRALARSTPPALKTRR